MVYGFGLFDILETAKSTGRDIIEVAKVYFVISERFQIDVLLSHISRLPRNDRWQTLARMALRYDLYAALAGLTAEVLQSTPSEHAPDDRVAEWEQIERRVDRPGRQRDGQRRRLPGRPGRVVRAAAPDPYLGQDLGGGLTSSTRVPARDVYPGGV